MGDVDGDGVSDLVVGAPGLDSGRVDAGGFYVVYLKRDGSLKLARPVDAKTFPALRLQAGDAFGSSLANAGDVDGDGTDDVAVSARQCDHGAIAQRVETGCAYVCFMISEKGEPRGCTRLAGPGMPKLAAHDFFGDSLAAVGDLDGDGIRELAVGATGDADSGAGAVYVLFLTKDAAVSKHAKISKAHEPWLPVSKGDHFGSACVPLLSSRGQTRPLLRRVDVQAGVLGFWRPGRGRGERARRRRRGGLRRGRARLGPRARRAAG
ncbi:hypothetical protein M885DRAFT_270281 [Pelagophyceae sp. CCMP2097]|nr:hypothetical protein M885DRAFT_270281 [Pelagophyceae sp. CCMP2097]